ncbi:GGDEF domain-containing protein [Pseudaminobacter sp. NGMCC 1.201702]|uniref:GGDEF domain-containing protein n=1 Tax=Pseudaminobacter sp. NGMCC 1.201702 TaxID=3391825 RepID=UPI0039EDE974
MENFTLFAANIVAAFVLATAFFLAGKARRGERYWYSWGFANAVIGMALVAFMFERYLPYLFLVIIPNCLLVFGLSLRWQAAREFAGRAVFPLWRYGPTALFVGICAFPLIYDSYAAVYSVVNVLLFGLAFICAVEFWRDHSDRLPSRYGMVVAYGVIAASFAARAGHGMAFAEFFPKHLPDDDLLTIHLSVAILHITASGAFALSLAYERDAIRLRQMADSDPLTGLLNRKAFETRVSEYLGDGKPNDFAMVLFDLDHFKQINDTFGHAVGDDALRACATVFTKKLPSGSLIGRWGGEEFVAFLPNVAAADALLSVERIRISLKTTMIRSENHKFTVTTSAGVCHSSCGVRDFRGLLSRTDAALYRAKDQGRDCIGRMVA